MHDYQREFLDFAIGCGALRFGEFILKSGRRSPYFFNTGLFDSGARLAALVRAYARAILGSGVAFDMLFGPAYKGIPLAAGIAIELHAAHGRDVPYCFDRKEAKDHGEGGTTVGAPLQGRVLMVDDVISAGTSTRRAVRLIRAAGAEPAGIAIALDRQERGAGERSAIDEVREREGLPVVSIVRLDDIVEHLAGRGGHAAELAAIAAYRARYGAA